MKTFYHVTRKENLESILENGLIPQVGERSSQLNEESGIFMFYSLDDMNNALGSWLGEEFEDDEELVSLKIIMKDTNFKYCAYEAVSREIIPPKYIFYFKDE